MIIRFLVAASLFAVSAVSSEEGDTSDRCKPMDVMMGVHKAEPVKPDQSPKGMLLPKPQAESTGPAVLMPGCKGQETRRRKKDDYPMV